MKKIITQVTLALLAASPLLAEDYPIELMVRDMGYTSNYMTIDVVNSVKKSNADAKAYYATKKLDQPKRRKTSVVEPQRGFEKEEILQPRISEASESPEMIPALLRYHKENPKADKITRKLAVTTYSLGQYKEALYWYTLTYQRNRSDLESLWNMASIADSIGEKQQARLYLREYARVDPNSAWGRMARNILNNGYSSDNMTESFDDQMARVLDSGSSIKESQSSGNKVKSSSSSASGDGMIVVSGDKYDLESFVASYKPNKNFNENSTKDGDTLKGKSQPKLSNKKEGVKTSLEKAAISEKKQVESTKSDTDTMLVPALKAAPLAEEDATVKTVADPLGD
ncbi:MAG: hypothetical protein II961_03715 [Candidatus Riflebacteria bacterium]|nr:hypothetical protein [Candidatus Riflebacteria bacterium]